MLNQFLNYFRDPEDNDPSFIQLTRNILIFSIVATIASAVVVATSTQDSDAVVSVSILGVLLILEVIAIAYVFRGNGLLAKILIPPALVIAITFIAFNGNSIHDISIIGYPLIIIVANLLQGRRSLFITVPLVLGGITLLGILDMNGMSNTPVAARTGMDDILIGVILLSAGAAMLNLLTRRLWLAIGAAKANEQAQAIANKELTALQNTLEQRVAERTTQLELANQRNAKRIKQFEAIAQVARATTSNENLNSLLPRLTSLISAQFGFYHTGIFLIDDNRQYAVLRAANSEGGKRMLARGHKLQIGQTGMVGFVSAIGTPRIALDVGSDAVYFDNPDLPNTRSEMALPLRVVEDIIGVLDVQSTEADAFIEENIAVLSTLADQVSIAIQNAKTYEAMQKLLAEADATSRGYLQDAKHILQGETTKVGYRVAGNEITPLARPLSSAQINTAIQTKQAVTHDGDIAMLAIPIRLRDEVIGVMDIRTPDEHEWDEDEVDIAEAVAERLSLALETSLLLKSTQRRADIERITADISGKIGATTQFDSILRTAAEELSRVLGGSEVLVQIQPLETPSRSDE